MSHEPSDRDLVAACLTGDQRSWKALVDRYAGLVYAVARRAGLSNEACDDLAQVVFTILSRKLSKINDIQTLPAWLGTTAQREAWRLKRRVSELDKREVGLADDFAADPAFQHEVDLRQRVEWGLAQLDPRCRELLRTLFLTDPEPSYEEAAAKLGLAPGSMGPLRRRCLGRLAEILGPSEAEGFS